ncbi:MAG: hypothetical protein U0234_29350 [Sandaracinus sp.]
MTKDLLAADGSAVAQAFERLAAGALSPEAPHGVVLEAAAMGTAVAVLGLLDRAPSRDKMAAKARRTLLTVGALRSGEGAVDEDARDALELAIEQARRGAGLLGGGPLSALDGPPALEPTPADVAKLLRGALDGHAAADVALRLHRSGARDAYAAFLPQREVVRRRLAADAAPAIRDPAQGRSLGRATLGAASLEAYAFSGAIAIYAEPAVALTLVSVDAPLAARPRETNGYLELALEGQPASLTLELREGQGEGRIVWSLDLEGAPPR